MLSKSEYTAQEISDGDRTSNLPTSPDKPERNTTQAGSVANGPTHVIGCDDEQRGINIKVRSRSPSVDQLIAESRARQGESSYSGAQAVSKPFKYYTFNNILSPIIADAIFERLEMAQGWILSKAPFYELHPLLLSDAFFGTILDLLNTADLIRVITAIERAFEVSLERRVEIAVHKMVAGQGVGLHSDDFGPGWETHRLVITLNKRSGDLDGGHLVFFNSWSSCDIHRVFRPHHNSAVCFELGPKSFHAVSDVQAGVRYSMILSLWSKKPDMGVAGSFDELMDTALRFVEEKGAVDASHSDLTSDLKGSALILRGWNCSKQLCLAGLFNSVYNQRSIAKDSVPSLKEVENVIGQEGERLVYLCKALTREDCLAIARNPAEQGHFIRAESGYLLITPEEFRDVITLALACCLDQLARLKLSEQVVLNSDKIFFNEVGHLLPQAARSCLSRFK